MFDYIPDIYAVPFRDCRLIGVYSSLVSLEITPMSSNLSTTLLDYFSGRG